uniref:Uncharacterized protein n=1 Tax=Spironucleus salmonicida TaxID=348837 RepID=V6LKN6_9EUKA|eukprot:EST44291.1 Hypothetical protein SS50377_15822 [Spironucleus salmonicida]
MQEQALHKRGDPEAVHSDMTWNSVQQALTLFYLFIYTHSLLTATMDFMAQVDAQTVCCGRFPYWYRKDAIQEITNDDIAEPKALKVFAERSQ